MTPTYGMLVIKGSNLSVIQQSLS